MATSILNPTNPCGEIFLSSYYRKTIDLLNTVVRDQTWYNVSMPYNVYQWVTDNYVVDIDYYDDLKKFTFSLWMTEAVYLMLQLKWA